MSFGRLREYNLKMKPRKCFFFPERSPFLGKLATTEGIAIDPNKVKAVLIGLSQLVEGKVESFLGFANYHRTHIKEYAHITVRYIG